jgi:hypothetical protein
VNFVGVTYAAFGNATRNENIAGSNRRRQL